MALDNMADAEKFIEETARDVLKDLVPDADVVIIFSDLRTLRVAGSCTPTIWYRIDDEEGDGPLTRETCYILTYFRPWIKAYLGDEFALRHIAVEEAVHVKYPNHLDDFKAEMARRGLPGTGSSSTNNKPYFGIWARQIVRKTLIKNGKDRWVEENDGAMIDMALIENGYPKMRRYLRHKYGDAVGRVGRRNTREGETIVSKTTGVFIRLGMAVWVTAVPFLLIVGGYLQDKGLYEVAAMLGIAFTSAVAIFYIIPVMYKVDARLLSSIFARRW